MARERRDAVVVGAGITGLFAAARLAERGLDVLCVERATVGHEWSGSKGTARIFRLGYDDPLYVDMARRSLEGWRSLEERAGEPLLVDCGLLSFGVALAELVDGMAAAGAEAEFLRADEVVERFPGLTFGSDAVLDPTAGVLRADRVLAALRRDAAFELREGFGIRAIEDRTETVLLLNEDAALLEAGVVVVCAGPGTAPLLETAGVGSRQTTTLEQVAYFRPRIHADLPAVAVREGAGQGTELAEQLSLYGLPDPASGCFKLGLHHAGPAVAAADLAGGGPTAGTEQELVDRLVAAVIALLPGLDPAPVAFERCVYDDTPDGDFIVDRAGQLVVGAGTSGHGFKFGPVLGSVLADLACGSVPEVPLDRFSLRRPALGFD